MDEGERLEILYHAAMPGWAKVRGLEIRPVPLCEGGGYMLRLADAEMIVAAHKTCAFPWLPIPAEVTPGVAPFKQRGDDGKLIQYLLIGHYPSNEQPTDIVQSWWVDDLRWGVGGWARWKHDFRPSFYMPSPTPPLPAPPREDRT